MKKAPALKTPKNAYTLEDGEREFYETVQKSKKIMSGSEQHSLVARIAREHNLNVDSLRRRLRRHQELHDPNVAHHFSHGNQSLSNEQELKLVAFARVCALRKINLTQQQIIDAARAAFHVDVGHHWCSGFINRHKIFIHTSKAKYVPNKRSDVSIIGRVDEWNAEVGEIRNCWHWSADAVFNTDASSLFLDTKKQQVNAICANNQRAPAANKLPNIGSMQAFIGADGSAVMFAFNWKKPSRKSKSFNFYWNANMGKTRALTEGQGFVHMHYGSPSGRFNGAQFNEMLTEFRKVLDTELGKKGLDVILLLDNASYQVTADDMTTALKLGILLLPLPTWTSMSLQALDLVVFSSTKMNAKKDAYAAMALRAYTDRSARQILTGVIYDGLKRGFTKENIQNSFLLAGMVPWNAERIKSNAAANVVDANALPPSTGSSTNDNLMLEFSAMASGALDDKLKVGKDLQKVIVKDDAELGAITTNDLITARALQQKQVTSKNSINSSKKKKKTSVAKRKKVVEEDEDDDDYVERASKKKQKTRSRSVAAASSSSQVAPPKPATKSVVSSLNTNMNVEHSNGLWRSYSYETKEEEEARHERRRQQEEGVTGERKRQPNPLFFNDDFDT